MEKLKQNYILILFFILAIGGDYMTGNDPKDKSRRIVQRFMKNYKIPGLSVTIGKSGEVIWSEGFGLADIEQNILVTTTTRFRIGSVSKIVTSAAVGRLLDQQKLDLDKEIQIYVPSFPEKKWNLTTRQAMGHLAGIRHYKGIKEFLNNKFYATVKEGLSIFQSDSLLHEPGSKYQYSSYAWNLVSAVVENTTDIDFLSYMEDTVFTALEMESIMGEHRDSTLSPIASFYEIEKGNPILAPTVDNSYKWAGGGFVSNTRDLVDFIHNIYRLPFLSKSTLFELQKSLRLNNGNPTGYGLGWHHYKDFWGNRIIGHGGGSVGGRAILIHYPEKDVTISVLVNSGDGGNLDRLAIRIANRFLD